MNIDRDEMRRQLSASQQDHAEAVPRFREALKRVFDPDTAAPAAAKAALLGVPTRRSFLTVGGATILGSAVLVGCGKSVKRTLPVSGTSIPEPASTTTTAPGSAEMDLTLLRTAQSIEALAVQTYQKAIDSNLITTPGLLDMIKLFQSQHTDHGNLLASSTTDAGGTPYDTANPFLRVEVIGPAMDAASDETSIVKVAVILEDTMAQTYAQAGGVFTTADLRAAITSIGATEARHLSVLYGVQGGNQVPLPLMPTRDAISPDGYIGPNGPVKEPTPPTTAAS